MYYVEVDASNELIGPYRDVETAQAVAESISLDRHTPTRVLGIDTEVIED